MLSKKMEKALNEQINAELYSAYLYLSMSAYFEGQNFDGFANWLRVQYQEETSHAMKIYDYVHERGGKVTLTGIDSPQTDWKNPVEVFEQVFEHEQHVTSLINNLVNMAIDEKDHATNNMLQWYVAEQVEEEANAEKLLEDVKMISGKGQGMLMLDRELKQRTFVDETKEEE